MKPVLVVARREYLHRVRSKWFIASTLGLPLLMGVIFAGPLIIESRKRDEGQIAVVDHTGILADGVIERLGSGFAVERVAPAQGVNETLDERVAAEEIYGYLVLDEETLVSGTARFRGDERPGTVRRMQMQQAVVQTALEVQLGAAGDLDVETLLSGGKIEYVSLGEESTGVRRAVEFAAGFVGAMLLYIILILYGVQVMRSVLEEKTTRIVEVIISAIQPWQLMLGKILGVGGVALTQLTIWLGTLAVLLTMGLPILIAAQPELAELQNVGEYLPAAGALVMFFAFFVLGFLLFSSLYAAVAAMCSTDEEAQQMQAPVIMLLIIPILFLAPIIEEPNGALAFWMSMVPFFSPVLMFPRYLGGAPLWQPLVSLVLVAVTIVGVAWVAGRIYRVGILMQGKRPTLPELMRWIREAN
jgi:ABC-2 type transport system permease protein